MTLLLETMDGELVNCDFLRSISQITGTTDSGATAYAIAGYWAADSIPVTDDPDEPVHLGYYNSESQESYASMFADKSKYDAIMSALAGVIYREMRKTL